MKVSSVIRKFTVLLALSALSLSVMNCSKKDGEDVAPQAQIVGSWKITNLFVKEGSAAEEDQFPFLVALVPCFKDIVITFNSNGTVTGSIPAACQDDVDGVVGDLQQAKYEVKGDQLIMTSSDGTKETINVSFSGKTMSWNETETTGGVTTTSRIVFTKQ
ncbi:lipocalin-like domain-containing protein [Emticicia fontis]